MNTSAKAMEHRWGRRITVEIPVRLEFGGQPPGRGVLRNASISGGFIETSLELPVFTNLVVCLPAGTSASPELAACVLRSQPGGFAVEWRDMACAAIVELLERISGRPARGLRDDEAFATIAAH